MKVKENVLVSACLMDIACRYDGKSNALNGLERLMEKVNPVPFCPEAYGGLPTPRDSAERKGNRVVTKAGKDVTDAFTRGAEECVKFAKALKCRYALMKDRSPSCGNGVIYDGTFSGTLTAGDGVCVKMLKENGISVFGAEEFEKLLEAVSKEE